MEDLHVRASIAHLLADAGIEASGLVLEATKGGGNNRVYVVHAAHNTKVLAKVYYRHSSDPRNRLAAEYAFLSYAWNIGIRCVPRPILCDQEKGIGLYEFIKGEKLTSIKARSGQVRQAAHFFLGLNGRKERDKAKALSDASEACFSVEQHFSSIDLRVERLRGLPLQSEIDHHVFTFIDQLEEKWQALKEGILRGARHKKMISMMDPVDRCVSPSDFGFHNALMRDSGEICFIDFEYAGWDDPAKMVGDFFSQPSVPVSMEYFDEFSNLSMGYSSNTEYLVERARLLLPMFQIKWCCIILNEFLPEAMHRRRFANPTVNLEFTKQKQFEKAQQLFSLISH